MMTKTTQVDPNRADSSKPSPKKKPDTTKSITFTPAQLIAWADKQEVWGTSPAWSKNPDETEGYARALRHLRHYVSNPIQEII